MNREYQIMCLRFPTSLRRLVPLLFLSVLGVADVAVAQTAGGTSGGPGGGSIGLAAMVPANCTVQINTGNPVLGLDSAIVRRTVASIGERCNSRSGYRITLASANGGALVNALGNRIPYTIEYDNSGVRSLGQNVVLIRNSIRPGVQTRSFRVNVPLVPNAIAGTYTDTVTVSIVVQ